MSKYSLAIVSTLALFLTTSVITNAQTDDYEGISPGPSETTVPVEPVIQEEPVADLDIRVQELQAAEQEDLQLMNDRYASLSQVDTPPAFDSNLELNAVLVSARYHKTAHLYLSTLQMLNQQIQASGGTGFGQEEALTDAEASIVSLIEAIDEYDAITQQYISATDEAQANSINMQLANKSAGLKVLLQSGKTSLMELVSTTQ